MSKKESLKDKLCYFLGTKGVSIGLGLIAFVSLYDVILKGARGCFQYGIHFKGIVTIWIGIVFIFLGKYFDEKKW